MDRSIPRVTGDGIGGRHPGKLAPGDGQIHPGMGGISKMTICNVWVFSGNLSVADPMAALPRAQNGLFGVHITAPVEKARKSLFNGNL